MNVSRKINKNLNALKFLMALLIIFCHVFVYPDLGHLCVCIFFMVSGYLLEKKFLRIFHFSISDINKSIKRIYPSYILMLATFLFMQYIIASKFELASFIGHVFFLQSLIPELAANPINGPSWYLSSYFVIYFLYILLYRSNSLLIRGAGCFVLISLWLVISPLIGYKHWWFYIFPIAHLIEFYIGNVIAHLENTTLYSKIKKKPLLYQVICIIIFIITLYAVPNCEIEELRMNLIFVPSSFIIVTTFIFTNNDKSCLNRLFNSNIMQWGGVMSLQIYIYHFLFVRIFAYATPNLNLWFQSIIVIILTLIFSWLMKRIYEDPILKLFENK